MNAPSNAQACDCCRPGVKFKLNDAVAMSYAGQYRIARVIAITKCNLAVVDVWAYDDDHISQNITGLTLRDFDGVVGTYRPATFLERLGSFCLFESKRWVLVPHSEVAQ